MREPGGAGRLQLNISKTIAAFTLIPLLSSCGWKKDGKQADDIVPRTAPGPAIVRTLTLEPAGDVRIEASGTLEASQDIMVQGDIPGTVKRVHVEEGDTVVAGDLLAELDPRDYKLGVRQASAALKAANLALEMAQTNLDRSDKLLSGGAMSAASYDGSKLQVDLAASNVEMAGIGLSMARKRLSQTRVRAAFDALVVKRMISVGSVVQAMPPTMMFQLQDVRTLRLVARVPEGYLGKVAVGDAMEAVFGSIGRTVRCTVTTVVGSVDPQTRSFHVVAVIDNAGEDMALLPGLFAAVTISHEGSDSSLVIPGSAAIPIQGQAGKARIFVVEAGKALARDVTVVALGEDSWIVTSGAAAGDVVVVSDPAVIADGDAVIVQGAPDTSP